MLESGDEVMDLMRYVFVRGEAWENIVMGEEVESVIYKIRNSTGQEYEQEKLPLMAS